MFVSQSWLDSTIDDCEISIQGYSALCFDRSRHGGGVLIYVKSLFTCSILFKTTEFECTVINVACFINPSPGSDVFVCFIGLPALLTLCWTLYLIPCAIYLYP